MATEHPRDEHGRVLPEPSWPPGREAPGDLEFLRRFVNTTNRENGADRFAEPLGLGTFLEREGRAGFLPEPADLARIVALRESLHAMTVGHGHGPGDVAPPDPEAFHDVDLGVVVDGYGLALVGRGTTPADRLVAELARIVLEHRADGTWDRLKACSHCRWVVYDTSRNRSGRWCSMDACGGRHNARAYRRRRARDDRT